MGREIESDWEKKNDGNRKMKRENGHNCMNTNTMVKIFCKSSKLMYQYEHNGKVDATVGRHSRDGTVLKKTQENISSLKTSR